MGAQAGRVGPGRMRSADAAAMSPASQWQLASLAVRQHATPPAVLGQGISVLSATGAVVVRRRDLVPGRVESGEDMYCERKNHGV